MWRFDLVLKNWEHLFGNLTRNEVANYAMPYPGGMHIHRMVMSGDDSSIYLFGGEGYALIDNELGYLNDLWKYNISSGTFEFLSGSQSIDTVASYGAALPGGMFEHGLVLDSTESYIYLFGGKGYNPSKGTV